VKSATVRTSVALLGSALLTIVIAGCGAKESLENAVDDTLTDPIAEASSAAEQAQDAINESNAEDLLNGLMTEGGSIDIGVDGDASVPDTFPAGLPLPSGDLVLSVAEEGTWNLSYAVPDSSEADSLAGWYTARPEYQVVDETDEGGVHVWAFIGPEYYVNVALLPGADGALTLIYGVATGTE
jgi:hypothetical protein